MNWKILLILVLLVCAAVFLWNNGVFRSALRALFGSSFFVEIEEIAGESVIEFDLTETPPAILSLGVYYPKNATPEEIDDDFKLFKVDKELDIKLFRNDELLKSKEARTIKRIYPDFRDSGYKVAVFYTFIWSSKIKIPGTDEKDTGKLVIDLNGQFKDFDLIIFDYGIR